MHPSEGAAAPVYHPGLFSVALTIYQHRVPLGWHGVREGQSAGEGGNIVVSKVVSFQKKKEKQRKWLALPPNCCAHTPL